MPYPMIAYFEQRTTGNFYWPCIIYSNYTRLCKGKTVFEGTYSPNTKIWNMNETKIICGSGLGLGVYKLYPFCNSFLGYWIWSSSKQRNYIYLVMKDVSYSLHVFEPYLKSPCDTVELSWYGDAYYNEHEDPKPIALTITSITPVSPPDHRTSVPNPALNGTTGIVLANINGHVNYFGCDQPLWVVGTLQISQILEHHKQGLELPYSDECDVQAPKVLVLSTGNVEPQMNILAEIRGDFLFGYWNLNMTFRMRYPRKYDIVIADLYKNG